MGQVASLVEFSIGNPAQPVYESTASRSGTYQLSGGSDRFLAWENDHSRERCGGWLEAAGYINSGATRSFQCG